ncbi:unnamed protein product [Brassica rapa subsp. narinosa]
MVHALGTRPGCPWTCKMQYKGKGGTKAFSLNAVNMNLGDIMFYVYLAHDIASILVATAAEKELLESIGMGKETQVEGPTIPAIGGGSNNAKSGQTDAYSVEAPGVEPLTAMEGWLMNAISDGTKEVNKKVKSLSDRLTLVENEVKSLRVSVSGMRELSSEGESDNPFDQDGSDNPPEEDGSDTPSEEDGGDTLSEAHKDGGSKDDSVLAIPNQVQSEHGNHYKKI